MLFIEEKKTYTTPTLLPTIKIKLKQKTLVSTKKSLKNKLFYFLIRELLKSPSIHGYPQLKIAYTLAVEHYLDKYSSAIEKMLTIDDVFPNVKGLLDTCHWLSFCNKFSAIEPYFIFDFIPQSEISGLPRDIWLCNVCDDFKNNKSPITT